MKLSDRVRPDVEAAPWVIEEIKKLEAELEVAQKFHKVAVQQRDQAHQEITSLRGEVANFRNPY